MKQKNVPKHQHLVPKCYLLAWVDPNTPPGHAPYVWLIGKDGTSARRRSPQKSLTKSQAYTITFNDGNQDFRVETTLSGIEGKFVEVRKTIAEKRDLSTEHRMYLAAFMATMHTRTDPFADTVKDFFDRASDLTGRMTAVAKNLDPAKLPPRLPGPREDTPVTPEDRTYLSQNCRPIGVESGLQAAAPLLWRMNWAFGEAPQGSSFVTSDNPCVWFDPTAPRRPPFYQGVGLAMRSIEVTMPISPQYCAIVTHDPSITGYLALTDAQVQELNRRTVGHCQGQFVSNSRVTLASWLDPGTPPPDAWDNRYFTDDEEPSNRSAGTGE